MHSMVVLKRALHTALWLASAMVPVSAQSQSGPPPEVRAAIQSIEQMLLSTGDAPLRAFAAERLAPTFRASLSADAMLSHLTQLRTAVGGRMDNISVTRDARGLALNISGVRDITIRFDLDASYKLTALALGGTGTLPDEPTASMSWEGVTWETLASKFREWETHGFSGVVMAQKGGHQIMREAFGNADASVSRATSVTNMFGIGSTPIDFTTTSILLLAQRGQLSLDDSLGRYVKDVPVDKRSITVRHLMTGRSGLKNFHDKRNIDWDTDLAWIDRATALQRILSEPLLFAPGNKEEHSHSAFGVLAAVIEIVSGKSYPDFVRSEIFKPLGMEHSGFNGERGAHAVADFAVGSGPSRVGLPNIPPNWGPTSWLVMGSGGMFSNLDDMAQYYAALRSGTLLQGDWAKWQQGEQVGVGGSNRGYFIFHVTNSRGESVLGLMNGEGRAPDTRAMLRATEALVFGK